MKLTATLLALLSLAVPSYAAAPRACRTATVSCSNRIRVVATSPTVNHQGAKPQFVVTAFAVPVAVPVAPFAPYWYGLSDYQETSSLRGSASQRAAHEALPRETQRQTFIEAEPRENAHPAGARNRETSIVAQKCASCHGRTSPKQGLSLVDPLSLSDADRLRAIRAVINGEMPPAEAEPLSEAGRTAILRELTDD
jgi:mono/diheme cytochrome c family protein